MNRLRATLLQAVLALAAVCSFPCARDAQAQVASPPPGKALVILYRADKQPVAGKAPIIANADRLGELGNGEYINAVVNPGRTFLRAGDRILTTLALQTSANQTYYVLVEAVPGQSPLRVEMRESSQAAARNALSQSRAAAPAAAAAAAPRVAAAPAPTAPPPPVRPSAPARPAPAAAPPPKPAPAPPPQRQVQATPPPKPAPPARPREPTRDNGPEWTFAVIAKTGAFNLASVSQSVGGQPITYKKSAKPVGALEAEFRHRDGYALGGELLYYKAEFTPDGTTLKGEQAVLSTTFNLKYYFEATSWLYPFIGAGLGYANSSFSGDFTGKASSFAFQGMAGADIRFSDSVGLYLEYKLLNAPTRDSNGQEFKAGGSGILVGLSIAF
jgi:opacity protein-like surface antigen